MTIPLLPAPARAVAHVALALFALACRDDTPKVNVTTTTTSSAPVANAPHAVVFDPPNGATGVDPSRTSLSVTFDRPMDPQGWAWVIESKATSPDLGDSAWDAAVRTNTVQAKLEPGRDYVLWVNSPQYPYFKDLAGTSAHPVRWTFSTAGVRTNGAPEAPVGMVRATPGGVPRVIRFEPANGASDVDPATTTLRATFDRPMSEGWSWVIEQGALFPETTGDASMSADGRQAMLPVRLKPGTTYVVWMNSEQHRDFADRSGVTLPPVRWVFATRAAK